MRIINSSGEAISVLYGDLINHDIEKIIIDSCYIEGSNGNAISVRACKNISITNCIVIPKPGYRGIQVNGDIVFIKANVMRRVKRWFYRHWRV